MKNKEKQLDNDKSCEYGQLLKKAYELIGNDQSNQALNVLDKVPQGCREYDEALFMKAMIVGHEGDLEKSFKFFQKFFAKTLGDENINLDEEYRPMDMEDPVDLFYCGLTYFYIFEDYGGAIEYFNKSLRIKPNQSEVLYYKALAFAFLGRLKKAVKIINKAIAIEPDNARYLNNKGVFLTELNHVSKAHKSFDDAIAVKPNSCSWSNKGKLYSQNDQYDKALYCFDEAMKLDSQDIFPVIGKAGVYMALNDFDNVDKYFEMAEKINCNDCDYLSLRGIYLLDKNEFKKSIEYFDRCLEIDEEWAEIWMYKSMALSELGRDEESQKCFITAMDLDPDSINVFDEVIVIED